ncbi:MAG: hypothetical protein ACREM2_02875, partial [Vulcanimicrobiaceae bacterium]
LALESASAPTAVRRLTLPGKREDVRRRTTVAALGLVWRQLERDAARATATAAGERSAAGSSR